MATGPKIVHKQFNSPIGLYSQNNIQETLNKHLQNLDNGTVGIDFSNPTTDKPTNLANSAVLRMLEEEERNRRGYPKLDPTQVQAILDTMVRVNRRFDRHWPPERAKMAAARSWDGQLNSTGHIYPEFMKATKKGQKKVVWPPVPETNGYHSPQQQRQPSPAYQNNAAQQAQKPQAPPQHAPQSPQAQYQQHHQPHPQNQHSGTGQPAYCEGRRQEACGLSKLIPVGPGAAARPVSPAPYHQGPSSPGVAPQPYRPAQGRWAPVASPLSPQAYGAQPNYQQQHSPQPQQYSPQPQQYPSQQQQYPSQQQYPQQQQYPPQHQQYPLQHPPQQYLPEQQQSQPQYDYQPPQRQFEPPPATITLRQQTPIHQKPSQVFASQPAATSYKDSMSSDPSSGGVNMRGDQKWPPQAVREAVAAENEARRQLAKGPACRPRKVKKDYSSFFAQHALNNNYPGYRAPPGTQHFEDLSGRSSY